MKKFTYPSIAVISLNAAESVMRVLAGTGEAEVKYSNVIEHTYSDGAAYNIWKHETGGR